MKTRGVARWGTFASALAVLVMVTGCPPIVQPPTACTADNAAEVCNDNLNCTTDTCTDAGVCDNAAVVCTDGETCSETTGACGAACMDAADCADDGDACTDAACNDGVCGTTTIVCDDSDACTDDSCDSATGCVNTDISCDDGDACTDDSCDVDTGCVNDDVVCDDGFACDTATGDCVATCVEDADCDDSNLCTDDVCTDGQCVSTDKACDDGLFCNGTESCDGATGDCVSSGTPCGAGEVCDENADPQCTAGTACTTDADCADDNVFCNGTESCNTTDSVCESSGDPCVAPATCNEDLNQCDVPPGEVIPFTLATDNLPGTGLDDTFSGVLAFNAPTGTNVPTIQTGDSANGGDGADVLNAQFNFGAVTTVAPTLTAIETINITDFGASATTLAGAGITGATSFNFSNSANPNVFAIPGLLTLADVGVANQAVGVTMGWATAATSGAADAMTLTLNGMTAGTLTFNSVTSNFIETLNIVSTGAASTVADIVMIGTTLTTVNISGDANFTQTATLDANVTTVNAGTATGNVNITQTNAGTFTFTGGSGDDTCTLGATYTSADTIDGGAGTGDTLGGTTAVLGGTTAIQTKVTNVEKLRVSDAHTTAINAAHFGSITDVTLDLGSNAGSITNAASGLKINQGLSGGGGAVGAGAFTVTVAGTGTGDVVTYTMNDAEQATTVTFNGVETLNIVSNDNLNGSAAAVGTAGQNTITGALTMDIGAAQQKIVITGDEQLNLTGTVTADEIDASGFGQPLIMGVAMTSTSGVTVTGGAAADTLFGSAVADIISGGDGVDTIEGEALADVLTGGAGADIFTYTTLTDSLNTGFDTVTDFVTASDKFEVTVVPTILGSGTAAADLNTASVASTGTTAGTLATDLATAAAAAAANAFDQAGDTLVVTVTGASIGGTNAVYLVIADGANLGVYTAAEECVVLLGGTSSTTLALGDFQ